MDLKVPGFGELLAMGDDWFSSQASGELKVPDFGMTNEEMVELFEYFGWYEDDQPAVVVVVAVVVAVVEPPCPTTRRGRGRRRRHPPLCKPVPAEEEEEDKEN